MSKGEGLKDDETPHKSIRLYILLQVLSLGACWVWFVAVGSVAIFGYTMSDFEWWLLFGAALAGIFGLRPNLERAIDVVWLQGIKTSSDLSERISQLRPIKRRIDFFFTLAVVAIFVILYIGGLFGLGAGVVNQ